MIEDNRKRIDLQPCRELPQSWESQGACPFCGSRAIKIVHIGGSPDYIACRGCESAFEVETKLQLIRFNFSFR
jgi:transcription elongation factor Elf1